MLNRCLFTPVVFSFCKYKRVSLSRVPAFSSPVFFSSFIIIYSVAILVLYSFALTVVGGILIPLRSPCLNLGPFFMAESCAVRNQSAFVWAVLGLCCCMGFSPVAVSRECSVSAVHGLLLAVASLVAHGLQSTWTQWSSHMDLVVPACGTFPDQGSNHHC